MNDIDVLNRSKDVEKVIQVINLLSKNKSNVSFAIDGAWGSGKTFVLGMLEEKIIQIQNEDTSTNRYIVFHYDCWKYDYYEEPILALVASMLDNIDNNISIIDESKKAFFVEALKELGDIFLSISNKVIEDKTGVSPKRIYNALYKIKKGSEERIAINHAYDKYFEFNKTLDQLRNKISELSEYYTVVFVVDELDRCLPVYAIKVLERLHHITNQIKNTITIIATDKTRLESIIRNTIGVEDINKYLKKFIQFEIHLSIGELDNEIRNRFDTYFSLFEGDDKDEAFEYIFAFLKGIEIRSIIRILERAELVHRLLFSNIMDYSFLCMEVLVAVLLVNKNYKTIFSEVDRINVDNFFASPGSANVPASKEVLEFIDKKVEAIPKTNWYERKQSFMSFTYIDIDNNSTLYEKLAYYWCVFHKSTNIRVIGAIDGEKKQMIENGENLKAFISMLEYIL